MRPRLLLIEDDAALRRSLVLTLADEGFEVQEARDGREGLRGVDTKPDAVLLDLGLPDIDGFELCDRLRHRTGNPILIISAHQAPDDVARGLQAGADDYLTKPFSAVELARRLRGLLQGSAASAARGRAGVEPGGGQSAVVDAGFGLTVIEARLSAELAACPGVEVDGDVLARLVWGEPPAAGSTVLVARISSLGRKLEAAGCASIETTEAGYRLSG